MNFIPNPKIKPYIIRKLKRSQLNGLQMIKLDELKIILKKKKGKLGYNILTLTHG